MACSLIQFLSLRSALVGRWTAVGDQAEQHPRLETEFARLAGFTSWPKLSHRSDQLQLVSSETSSSKRREARTRLAKADEKFDYSIIT